MTFTVTISNDILITEQNKKQKSKEESNMIFKGEVLIGRVTTNLRAGGCFIETDDGATAFMPNYNFKPDTRVVCSVVKTSKDKFPLVDLDSVLYDEYLAA